MVAEFVPVLPGVVPADPLQVGDAPFRVQVTMHPDAAGYYHASIVPWASVGAFDASIVVAILQHDDFAGINQMEAVAYAYFSLVRVLRQVAGENYERSR